MPPVKSHPIRAAFLIVAALFLALPWPAPGQTPPLRISNQMPSHQLASERIILVHDYIPSAETEGWQRSVMWPAEVMVKYGANTPIEALRQAPFFVGTTATENDSNGGDGTASINLYGLGSRNVVTLINGRRAFSFSDINAIPLGALSLAEITDTGTYGSDSAAGVVNFNLLNGPGEKPYEGAELHALYGNTTEADAHVRQVYLRGGVTGLDERVSIAAAAEYYSRAGLFARDREISSSGDRSNDSTGLGLGGSNLNGPTFGGRVNVVGRGNLVLINLSENQVTPGSYRGFENGEPGAFPVQTDPSRFNFRDFTPAIPAMEKAMYFLTGRYKIFGDGLQLYGDLMYSKVKQDNAQAGAPFTLSTTSNGRAEARASQFNPFGNNLASVSYRLQQELGNRESFFDKDYYRYVAGVNGEFNIKDNSFISRFNYDSGFVYERLNYQRIDSGDARRSYLRSLIAPVGYTPALPRAPTGTFNPFIGINAPIRGTAPTYLNGVPTGLVAPYDNSIAALDWTQGGASYVGHSFFYERDWLADLRLNAHLFPN